MQQASKDSLQWNKLESRTNDNLPTGKEDRKIFTSSDHLIVLGEEKDTAYTFHLTELYWSKHQINNQSGTSMSSKSCMARDGLIVDLKQEYSKLKTLKLLTFDTQQEIMNFCQIERELGSSIEPPTSFHLQADQKAVYVLTLQEDIINSSRIYRVDLDSYKVSQASDFQTNPYLKTIFSTFLENDRLFILGGKNSSLASSELWIFNTSQEKWEQLDNPSLASNKNFPELPAIHPSMLVQRDKIYLYVTSMMGDFVIFSRRLGEKSWKTLSPLPSRQNNISRGEITLFRNSIILLDGSEVYFFGSPDLCRKKRKPKLQNSESLMKKLYADKPFPDVVFRVGKKEFSANKCILSANCSYFNKMFTSQMMEPQEKIIPIKNVRENVFEALIQYIYLNECPINKDIAQDLFKLSHEYMLEELQADCEEFLLKDLKIDCALKMLKLAETYKARQLQEACFSFIGKNFDKVFKNSEDIKDFKGETIAELFKHKK
jgi:hypothetical protein